MCFGGGRGPTIEIPEPVAPTIQYIGPSEDDIARQEASLQQFSDQITQQNASFESTIQSQIDQANAATADLEQQLAAALSGETAKAEQAARDAKGKAGANAASAAAGSAAQQGALTVSTTQSQAEMPQTTAAVTDKKKPKKNLKISTAGTESGAGSGLNIGI